MGEFLRAKALCPVGHALGRQLSTESESGFCRKPEGTTMWLTLEAEKGGNFFLSATNLRSSVTRMNGNGSLEFSENRGVTRKRKQASQEGEALEAWPMSRSTQRNTVDSRQEVGDLRWSQGSKNNAWRTSKILLTQCPNCLGAQAKNISSFSIWTHSI